MSKKIEFVCKGNNGRSPVAERIAANYLEKLGVTNEYVAVSSGVNVDRIRRGGFDRKILEESLNAYRQIGWGGPIIDDFEGALLGNVNDGVLKKYSERFFEYVWEKEKQSRNKLLKAMGVQIPLKQIHEQTIPNEHVIAILPMDKTSYVGVLDIYSSSNEKKYFPRIGLLKDIANNQDGGEITFRPEEIVSPKSYKKGFKRILEEIIEVTPLAIDKILEGI